MCMVLIRPRRTKALLPSKKRKNNIAAEEAKTNKEDDALSRWQGKMVAGKHFDAAFVSQTSALS